MKKSNFLILFILNLALVLNFSASACQCKDKVGEIMSPKFYNETDAIFVAKIDSVSRLSNSNEFKISFTIKKTYKGDIDKSLWLYGSSTCAAPLLKGKVYLVYASFSKDSTYIFTTLCSRTREFDGKDNKAKRIWLQKLLKKQYRYKVKLLQLELSTLKAISTSKEEKNTFFYDKGRKIICATGNYKNHSPEGLWEYYFVNGLTQGRGTYRFGKKDGYWEESDWSEVFDISNYKLEKGRYFDGRRIGLWFFHDSKGNLISQIDYK
jgi:hypothetical protein